MKISNLREVGRRERPTEAERIHVLHCANLLDTPPDPSLDQITRLTSQIFGAPISLVSLVDEERQWFKSRTGLEATQTDRQFSFCSLAIEQPDDLLVVEDAASDTRFRDNPLVTGPPHIRFYAGAALRLASGHALGSLCVIDTRPRTFSAVECEQLIALAALATTQLELHVKSGRVHEVSRLPNRAQMAEDIRALASAPADGSNREHAMLLIEIMAYNDVQEMLRTVGIAPLERALQQVAVKLRSVAGAGRRLYQVGETRFCVDVPGASRADKEAFAHHLLDALEEPFKTGGVTIQLEVQAGIAAFATSECEHVDVLRRTTSAMHEAAGRCERLRWHDPRLDITQNRSFGLMGDILPGLANGEFRLVYQPKFNVDRGVFSGVEALARWSHPVFGDLSPAEFIPLIERTSLIHDFTPWVVRTAVAQLVEWRAEGLDLTVAVNVSSKNLERHDFVGQVHAVCLEEGLPPALLHIECTENAVMTGEATRLALLALRGLGMKISLDDFGMGYSNLACLKDLPVHMLKIDQSLIKPMENDEASRELVRALISLGHSLGFRILGEGVENEYLFRTLVGFGCNALQGFFLARPMERDAVAPFLERQQRVQSCLFTEYQALAER